MRRGYLTPLHETEHDTLRVYIPADPETVHVQSPCERDTVWRIGERDRDGAPFFGITTGKRWGQ